MKLQVTRINWPKKVRGLSLDSGSMVLGGSRGRHSGSQGVRDRPSGSKGVRGSGIGL